MEEMVTLPEVDVVMVATTGAAGLQPTLNALREGKAVALSNKEPIVMAGPLLKEQESRYGGAILPVDSEPSAIWQCIQGEANEIRRLIITASGGPFRTLALEEMAAVTPEQALKHPTWRMGPKITIDSATLMNKAFEVIESHWLFDVPWENIEVVVHPQSTIHSMVEFADGSVKAQLGPPSMRLPIQYALFYPERRRNPDDSLIPRLDTGMAQAPGFPAHGAGTLPLLWPGPGNGPEGRRLPRRSQRRRRGGGQRLPEGQHRLHRHLPRRGIGNQRPRRSSRFPRFLRRRNPGRIAGRRRLGNGGSPTGCGEVGVGEEE